MIQYDVADGLALVRLSRPPLNAITFSLLDALTSAIERAVADGSVRAVVLTGEATHFSAGADVNLFREIRGREDACRLSRVFQQAFQVVEDSPKPVAAALAGHVMGGALELALACHFRVAAPAARFSMPEVNLGINPGAGGTQRLPRLVGPSMALDMMLTARPVDARAALAAGLVDAVADGDRLLESARELLRSASGPRMTSRLTEKVGDASANEAALARAEPLLAKSPSEIIAPRKIVEAVRVGLNESFQAGLAAEQDAFAACMETPATRNKIDLFFAMRGASKVAGLDGAKPAPVAKAAVIGMGSMGTGIAQALVEAGLPVVVRDEDEAALHRGVERIGKSLAKRVDQGRLSAARSQEMLRRVATTTAWDAVAEADLVIEAVYEEASIKRAVLARLEEVCRPEAVLASNTSTISLDVLAREMQHPERLVGMHFFNPAHRMPLVEIVRHASTSRDVVAAALDVARRLRKTAVVVQSREGFVVNRLFIPYLKEAFWLVEEGADPRSIDHAMVEFGMPMGPLALIDMAGLDVLALTDAVLRDAFPRHGPLSEIVARLVERRHLGQKSGSGVYRYEKGDYAPHESDVAGRIIDEVRRGAGRERRQFGREAIVERLVLRMVAEASYVVEERVVDRASDLDVATVLGIGFPDFRGGVWKHARHLGGGRVTDRLGALTRQFGPRFSPSERFGDLVEGRPVAGNTAGATGGFRPADAFDA